MQVVKVKKVSIGEGKPKICLPLVGKTLSELIREAHAVKGSCADLAEWRADFYEEVEEIGSVIAALTKIREVLPELPLIFTFRSKKEGGERFIHEDRYFALNEKVITSGQMDLIDLEWSQNKKQLKEMIEIAQKKGIKVIVSHHDFLKTPPEETIVSYLLQMQETGADITKIAVMPRTPADVICLLSATNEMKQRFADRPFITMAMSELGIISRISGGIFGSAVSFAALKKSSAPGQLKIDELSQILTLLDRNMRDFK